MRTGLGTTFLLALSLGATNGQSFNQILGKAMGEEPCDILQQIDSVSEGFFTRELFLELVCACSANSTTTEYFKDKLLDQVCDFATQEADIDPRQLCGSLVEANKSCPVLPSTPSTTNAVNDKRSTILTHWWEPSDKEACKALRDKDLHEIPRNDLLTFVCFVLPNTNISSADVPELAGMDQATFQDHLGELCATLERVNSSCPTVSSATSTDEVVNAKRDATVSEYPKLTEKQACKDIQEHDMEGFPRNDFLEAACSDALLDYLPSTQAKQACDTYLQVNSSCPVVSITTSTDEVANDKRDAAAIPKNGKVTEKQACKELQAGDKKGKRRNEILDFACSNDVRLIMGSKEAKKWCTTLRRVNPTCTVVPKATHAPEHGNAKRSAVFIQRLLRSVGIPDVDSLPAAPLQSTSAEAVVTSTPNQLSPLRLGKRGWFSSFFHVEPSTLDLSSTGSWTAASRMRDHQATAMSTVTESYTVFATSEAQSTAPTEDQPHAQTPSQSLPTSSSSLPSPTQCKVPAHGTKGPSIKGKGGSGYKKNMSFPNKHGSDECKSIKHCTTSNTKKPCIQDIREKVYQMACNHPEKTFEPMKPIVCSPSDDGDYCAYVQYVPFRPKSAKLFDHKYTNPYQNMTYNQVPIGAIKEGVDWIINGKAKLCGQALLPVPTTFPGDGSVDQAYLLRLDVDHGLHRHDD